MASNIYGGKGRPIQSDARGSMINPARRSGINTIRDQMNGENVPLKDRLKARSIDHQRGSAVLAGQSEEDYTDGADQTAPAPTQAPWRKSLDLNPQALQPSQLAAIRMRPEGVSPQAALGMQPSQMSAVRAYQDAVNPPKAPFPSTDPLPSSGSEPTPPNPQKPTRSTPVPAPGSFIGNARQGPSRRINKETGMPFGTMPAVGDQPADPGYRAGWDQVGPPAPQSGRNPNQSLAGSKPIEAAAPKPQPKGWRSSTAPPKATPQPAQLGWRQSIAPAGPSSVLPGVRKSPPPAQAPLPALPVPATPAPPSGNIPVSIQTGPPKRASRASQTAVAPAPVSPSPSERISPVASDPQVEQSRRIDEGWRDSAKRASVARAAKDQHNANVEVPTWARGTGAGWLLRKLQQQY